MSEQMTQKPCQPGLTRRNTGYPAEWWFGNGWFYSQAEVERQKKRARARWEPRTVALESVLPKHTCRTCGATFTDPKNHRKADCEPCRKAKRKAWNGAIR